MKTLPSQHPKTPERFSEKNLVVLCAMQTAFLHRSSVQTSSLFVLFYLCLFFFLPSCFAFLDKKDPLQNQSTNRTHMFSRTMTMISIFTWEGTTQLHYCSPIAKQRKKCCSGFILFCDPMRYQRVMRVVPFTQFCFDLWERAEESGNAGHTRPGRVRGRHSQRAEAWKRSLLATVGF